VGAKNLVDSPEVYEKLTPWEPPEILRPFRKYYELKISLGNLNPRTSAILLMRAETGADTYTSALYLSTTLRAKISSLQSIASWKRNNARDILKHIPHKQGPLKKGGYTQNYGRYKGTMIFTSLLAKTYPQRRLNA